MKMKHSLLALSVAVTGFSPVLHASEPFDLQTLVNAAKQEPAITIYAPTGKIVQQARDFTKKYGVKAVGIKAKAPNIIEIISRESQANNVKADVALIEDAPAAQVQLLDKGYVKSWVPGDMTKDIRHQYQQPLTVVLAPNVWSYNTAQYDKCPITNIWQLTEPKWKHKIAMQDPLIKPLYSDSFNQMATHYDKQMADAYQKLYGKPLKTDESSATAEFVKRLAQNGPLLTKSDGDAAQAIGAPDVKDSFVGLISTAKYRENKHGMKLGICHDMTPFIGVSYPTIGVITTKTNSPNASKLFIHYLMTSEGIKLQGIDGKMSTNVKVPLPKEEASGIEQYRDELMKYQTGTSVSDWQSRQDWMDLWSMNYQR
ncbi:ABC transporter substrate-binding protein [Vibrio salinus]|uniref:ABC transporter substrate-binding protein n=1 Tax=Vibrio salinus TaxID=2899784 RepID=UPI001E352B79|nr:ABC transporter substrate-binding protein [Vibrio salinus]MCE0495535.1 ABC transporter substrate-binding protein [Vibrio salinus]